MHRIYQQRKEHGIFYHLEQELELDEQKYYEYFRMSPNQMEEYLNAMGPSIQKQATVRYIFRTSSERNAFCHTATQQFLF